MTSVKNKVKTDITSKVPPNLYCDYVASNFVIIINPIQLRKVQKVLKPASLLLDSNKKMTTCQSWCNNQKFVKNIKYLHSPKSFSLK